jgi:hypothetical protein
MFVDGIAERDCTSANRAKRCWPRGTSWPRVARSCRTWHQEPSRAIFKAKSGTAVGEVQGRPTRSPNPRPRVGEFGLLLRGCFEACIAQLKFPVGLSSSDPRTTNLPRASIRGRAPACLRRARRTQAHICRGDGAAERWRGVRMTEFNGRQLQAIRGRLDGAHAERTGTRRERNRHRIPNSLYPARTGLDRTRYGRNSQDYLLTLQLLLRRYRRNSQ